MGTGPVIQYHASLTITGLIFRTPPGNRWLDIITVCPYGLPLLKVHKIIYSKRPSIHLYPNHRWKNWSNGIGYLIAYESPGKRRFRTLHGQHAPYMGNTGQFFSCSCSWSWIHDAQTQKKHCRFPISGLMLFVVFGNTFAKEQWTGNYINLPIAKSQFKYRFIQLWGIMVLPNKYVGKHHIGLGSTFI